MSKLAIFLAFTASFLVMYFGYRYFAKTKPAVNQPAPTPIVSESGNIIVSLPHAGDSIGNVIRITGEARVFENSFAYRISDDTGKVLKLGYGMADAPDIGQFGSFDITTDFDTPTVATGKLEVFEFSAKDGSEINKVIIPLTFQPSS
jgi:hypothetical protein